MGRYVWTAQGMLVISYGHRRVLDPSSFKGFENSAQPGCGTTWTTGPGNSPTPTAGPLPAYMAVIAASIVTSSGSTITGNTVHIVTAKTSASYASDPGHAGTVDGTYCC
jgi:hypothetical protein